MPLYTVIVGFSDFSKGIEQYEADSPHEASIGRINALFPKSGEYRQVIKTVVNLRFDAVLA